MKNIYCFLAGLLVAFMLLRGWQSPVGRYQPIVTEGSIGEIDTATGAVWGFDATSKKWKEIVSPKKQSN